MYITPVWRQETTTGFRQEVFIMYHATQNAQMAGSILRNGLRPSTRNDTMLGDGIYVSRDVNKCLAYGPIVFRLFVYTGRVYRVTGQGDRKQKTWQSDYGSAWVPPNCGMVPSGLEENCIKEASQIGIIGIVRGFHLLSKKAKRLTNNKDGFDSTQLYSNEESTLDEFLEDLGLKYFRIRNETMGHYVVQKPNGDVGHPIRLQGEFYDRQFWTRSWADLIENKETGDLLYFDDENLSFTCHNFTLNHNSWYKKKWSKDPGSGPLIDAYLGCPMDSRLVRRRGKLQIYVRAGNLKTGDYDMFNFEPEE